MRTKHEKQTVDVTFSVNQPAEEEIDMKPDIKDCETKTKIEDVHWVRQIVMQPTTTVKSEVLDCPFCSSKCPTKSLLILHMKHAHDVS